MLNADDLRRCLSGENVRVPFTALRPGKSFLAPVFVDPHLPSSLTFPPATGMLTKSSKLVQG